VATVDQDRESVDVFLQRRRDGKAAKRAFKRGLKAHQQAIFIDPLFCWYLGEKFACSFGVNKPRKIHNQNDRFRINKEVAWVKI